MIVTVIGTIRYRYILSLITSVAILVQFRAFNTSSFPPPSYFAIMGKAMKKAAAPAKKRRRKKAKAAAEAPKGKK